MIVEDYSDHSVPAGVEHKAPTVYGGKFVHITGPHEEFLVLSPVELTEYHAHIVQRFSRRRRDISSISSPSGNDVRFGTPGWRIKGGGWFRLDHAAGVMHLWGASKAYGKFDGAYLRKTLATTDGWEHVTVRLAEPE
ncbi:MAG: hypothetical protein AB1792_05275 [Candidatus Zixiibacteriota bacterium]